MLCVVMTVSFTSCSLFATEETEEDEFVAATLDVGNALPASEAEIVAFYNDIITKVQTDSNFTAANKPGVNASESINADGIKVLAYDTATGEAAESDALKGLNASAKTIKDRMLSGIDTSIPVIAFGDMNTSISSVIYPYDSAVSNLTVEDVVKAECNADGSNLNISIETSPLRVVLHNNICCPLVEVTDDTNLVSTPSHLQYQRRLVELEAIETLRVALDIL